MSTPVFLSFLTIAGKAKELANTASEKVKEGMEKAQEVVSGGTKRSRDTEKDTGFKKTETEKGHGKRTCDESSVATKSHCSCSNGKQPGSCRCRVVCRFLYISLSIIHTEMSTDSDIALLLPYKQLSRDLATQVHHGASCRYAVKYDHIRCYQNPNATYPYGIAAPQKHN